MAKFKAPEPSSEEISELYQELENVSPVDILAKVEDKAKVEDNALAQENLYFLHAAKLISQDRLDELIAQQYLVESKYTVTITGWLPKKQFNETKNILEKEFENRIIINDITKSVKNRDEIPVLLDNPESVKPFELILSLLQPPKYGSLDPTKLLALFFPIFFGLIVGDAGYGLVFLIISLLLKRLKNPIIKSASKLVSYLAVSTIVFGILFEEFFGELVGKKVFGVLYLAELLEKVFGKYPLLHRQEEGDMIAFLILAISIGACHILLGLILGIVEAVKQRHQKEVFEKISIILSLFGLFFLVATMSNILPKGFFVPSMALLVVSLPVLIVVKGFIGPLEAISTVANILSYARIMAVGTASVMMAYVANEFGGRMGNVILGVIVASLIHILNIALAAFSPTIQSARLHYVEFFGKFYEQGGKKYIPFKKEGHV